MTIDQILLKLEGLKKDPSKENKKVFAFIESLYHNFTAIQMIKLLHNGNMSEATEEMKSMMTYADYNKFISAKTQFLSKTDGDVSKTVESAFTVAYLAHEIALEVNIGFMLGVTHILYVIEQLDRVKVNQYVEQYKKEQNEKSISETIALAFNTCSEFLTTGKEAEKAISALYVLRYYILNQIKPLSSNLDTKIDEMLDEVIQNAIEAYNEEE